jgi:hypothetical protein
MFLGSVQMKRESRSEESLTVCYGRLHSSLFPPPSSSPPVPSSVWLKIWSLNDRPSTTILCEQPSFSGQPSFWSPLLGKEEPAFLFERSVNSVDRFLDFFFEFWESNKFEFSKIKSNSQASSAGNFELKLEPKCL